MNGQADYTYQREALGHGRFIVPSEKGLPVKIGTLITRVYINDVDLVNKGRRGLIAEEMTNLTIENSEPVERRRTTFRHLANMGLVHGFNEGDDASMNKTLIDVIFTALPSSRKCNLDRGSPARQGGVTKMISPTSSEESLSGVGVSKSSREEGSDDSEHFDFSTRINRDENLLARDADVVYKGDKEIQKYWLQRYRLFTRLDEGVLMDREGWFSVTPERIAKHIAERMIRSQEPFRDECVILDAFTGVGGNAIQFALAGAHVIAIDIDPLKLRCAKENAAIYNVQNYIQFICGDFFIVAASLLGSRNRQTDKENNNRSRFPCHVDSVFLSPPWGGPSYNHKGSFDMENDLLPCGARKMMEVASQISPNICFFLPKSTTAKSMINLAQFADDKCVEIEEDVLNKKTLKTLTGYYGGLIARDCYNDLILSSEDISP